MKRNDVLLFLGFLLLSFLFFLLLHRDQQEGAYAVVRVDGSEVARLPLDGQGKQWEANHYVVKGTTGDVVLALDDGCVYVEQSSCPDGSCRKQGKISKTGEQIVCLPNQVVIEIVGGEEGELDMIVR